MVGTFFNTFASFLFANGLLFFGFFNLNRLRSTLRTIENQQRRREENDPADLQDEENPKNLVTFLKWMLGDVPEAEAMAAREVQERPNNILALSNSAYVLWQKGETGQAWRRLEKLEALRAGDQQVYDDLEMEGRPFKLSCISIFCISFYCSPWS